MTMVFPGSGIPANCPRPLWESTVAVTVTRLRAHYPELATDDRLDSAVVLVRDGHVALQNDGGPTLVASRTEPGKAWEVNGTCKCPDAQHAPKGRCAHRIAAGLYKQVLLALEPKEGPALQRQEPQTPMQEPEPQSVPQTETALPLATQADIDQYVGESVAAAIDTFQPATSCPEAAFSLCLRGYLGGIDAQLTIRGQSSGEFLANVKAVSGLLTVAPPTVTQPQVPSQDRSTAQVPAAAQEDHAPTATRQGVKTFRAATLHRNEMDGRILFNIKGPDMPRYNAKFGMRIWPETLTEAGFNADALETMRAADFPPLTGWTAEYVMKEDDATKPDKIIRLVKS